MNCPHCGGFIATPLNQPPVSIPSPIYSRWNHAKQFLNLAWCLDGNLNDATLLCLLIEDQLQGKRSSIRELVKRSNNRFSRDALTALKNRVANGHVPRVLTFTEDDDTVAVDLPLVWQLATEVSNAPDAAFLWFLELTAGSFREAIVLALLLRLGADHEAKKLSPRGIAQLSDGLYTNSREIGRALTRLAPFGGEGLVKCDVVDGTWSLNSALINSRLTQRALAWVNAGHPVDPWEAGMELLLAQSAADTATEIINRVRTVDTYSHQPGDEPHGPQQQED